jgi:hypothetical protein
MSPTTRYIIRIAFLAIVTGAASLQAALPGISLDDGVSALIAAVIASGAYAGIGAATPLEPKVGKKSS